MNLIRLTHTHNYDGDFNYRKSKLVASRLPLPCDSGHDRCATAQITVARDLDYVPISSYPPKNLNLTSKTHQHTCKYCKPEAEVEWDETLWPIADAQLSYCPYSHENCVIGEVVPAVVLGWARWSWQYATSSAYSPTNLIKVSSHTHTVPAIQEKLISPMPVMAVWVSCGACGPTTRCQWAGNWETAYADITWLDVETDEGWI